ncbi:MAG: PilZ domain-containing protein [Planctomycetota bacterium]
MVKEIKNDLIGVNKEECESLINEMELNTTEEIRRRRSHFRYAIKTTVILQPANASQLMDFKVQGMTRDISSGGVGALFPVPVGVGDVYRLQFNRADFDLPLVFARCLSCAFVREGAYSVGFKFFSTITLPENFSMQTVSPSSRA